MGFADKFDKEYETKSIEELAKAPVAALQGISRQHAIVGGSAACIATHPSDMAVAMRVLDATVETVRADGSSRSIPIADFHRLPGDTPEAETAIRHGELIASIVNPPTSSNSEVRR